MHVGKHADMAMPSTHQKQEFLREVIVTQQKPSRSHTYLSHTRRQYRSASFMTAARVIQQLTCKLQQMYASLCPHPLRFISKLAYCIIILKSMRWVSR